MKKILFLIFAVLLLLSTFSLGAFQNVRPYPDDLLDVSFTKFAGVAQGHVVE